MNHGKYVFAQLVEFLPQRVFDGIVKKYDGDKYVRHFSCWNQLLCMLFGQLTNRDSLRDLIITLEAHSKNPTIWVLGKVSRGAILQKPMKSVIAGYSRSSLIT